jgi:hypothetical protein
MRLGNHSLIGATGAIAVFLLLGAPDWQGPRAALAYEPEAKAEESKFFVSPRGKDSWSGRVAEPSADDGPFATIGRAKQAVREFRKTQTVPVRVTIRGGTYFLDKPLEFWPGDSGTEKAPITYAAAAREKVVLSGGRRLTGGQWGEVNGQKAWMIDLPEVKINKWKFRQLFVNGERRPRTRLPKMGMYRIESLPGYDWKRRTETVFDGTKQFVYSGTDVQRWRNLQDVEVIGIANWLDNRLPVQEVDVDKRLVTFDRRSLFTLDDEHYTGPPKPSVYWVENVFEKLDTPGQWYVDRPQGRLYYLPRPGEDMQTAEIIAPRLPQVMRLVGWEGAPVAHVHFEGLTFSHTEWEPPTDWAASLQAGTAVPGAVYFDFAERCSLRKGAIEHTGTYGVEVNMGCIDIEISHNRMADIGAGGVKVGHFFDHEPNETGERRTASLPKGPRSQRITVADNEITDGGRLFASSAGVFVGENPGNTIEHNHIFNMPWVGISVGSLQTFEPSQAMGNVVEYNNIHHIGDGVLSDMGGIYTNSISPGTRIRYNIVHDVVVRDYGAYGLYTDQGSTNILIEKNLVYNCGSSPYFPNHNLNMTIENNIFAFGKSTQVQAYTMDRLAYTLRRNIIYYTEGSAISGDWNPVNMVFDRNLYWNAVGKPVTFQGRSFADWQAAGQDVHGMVADPLFVDPEHGDFRLRSGSPAVQIGFEPWDFTAVGPRP